MFQDNSFTFENVSYFRHGDEYNSRSDKRHDIPYISLSECFGDFMSKTIDNIIKQLVDGVNYEHVEAVLSNYNSGISQIRLIMFDHNFKHLRNNPMNCICYNITHYFGNVIVYKYVGLRKYLYFNGLESAMFNEIPRYNDTLNLLCNEMARSLSPTRFYKNISIHHLEPFNKDSSWTVIFKNGYFKHGDEKFSFDQMCDADIIILFNKELYTKKTDINSLLQYSRIKSKA